jgi:hypothetical protein
MAWTGQVSYRWSPSAPTVRLKGTLVPTDVIMDFAGDNGHPDWTAHFRVIDGRPECLEMKVTAKENGRGVRTADVNTFNIDNLAIRAFAQVGGPAQSDDPNERHRWLPAELHEHQMWQVVGDITDARRERRGGVSTAELQEVAEIYLAHIDKSPTATVQILKGYSMRTAARRVQQAAAKGLLPESSQGKKRRK